ncbi:MAG: tripartite tricarboxylate transporter substrate binding protein, partial [Burkholderiales bacterium]|nr:tripartite tricarboxylate transporter substrate binding protein [Burkholderiales bacterium]
MNTKRISRFIFSVLAPALALGLAAGLATAQNYPGKPVSFIVPYGPGTGNDIIARILSHKVGES